MTACPDDMTPLRAVAQLNRREISACGVWSYERSTAGLYRRFGLPLTPSCVVRHLPTGAVAERTPSLSAGRRLTASGAALASVRSMAQRQADGVYGPDPVARAKVVLQILDGTILPAGAEQSRCVCGGYLTDQAGKWLHVDTCDEEAHDGVSPCPDDRSTHRFCLDPEPVQCDHSQCHRANVLSAVTCQIGHDYCCGCCT